MNKCWIVLFTLFIVSVACAQLGVKVERLDAQAFAKRISKASETIQLLDVRTPEECTQGMIPKAQNVNVYDDDFEAKVSKYNKNETLYVYCKSGGRSRSAVERLQSIGFRSLVELSGGIMDWERKGLPIASNGKTIEPKEQITLESYQKLLDQNEAVFVDFYAPWCAPCKRMKPILDSLEKEYKGKVCVLRINVDESKALSKSLNIASLPVIFSIFQGKIVNRYDSEMNEQEMRAEINHLLKLIKNQ